MPLPRDVWAACRDAQPLALCYGENSADTQLLANDILSFKKAFYDLQSILKQEQKSTESYSTFAQTLDQCNDFLKDYHPDSLQQAAEASQEHYLHVAKRSGSLYNASDIERSDASLKVSVQRAYSTPSMIYDRTRYVYTKDEADAFWRSVNLQILIMRAIMNWKVLSVFVLILDRNASRPEQVAVERKSDFGSPIDLSRAKPIDTKRSFYDDIVYLYQTIVRLRYRLKRTGPQIGTTVERLESLRLEKGPLLEALRRKVAETTHGFKREDDIPAADTHELLDIADRVLKTSLSIFKKRPVLILRRRVFAEDESLQPLTRDNGGRGSISSAMSQSHYGSAWFSIEDLAHDPDNYVPSRLRMLDIIDSSGMRSVVCTEEETDAEPLAGIVHEIPSKAQTYPFTMYQEGPVTRKHKKVSFVDSMHVKFVGTDEFDDTGRVAYFFSLRTDLHAFQSLLRDKHLLHSFNVRAIESKRGKEAIHQQLKLWSDFGSKHQTLSYYQHCLPGVHPENIEFSLISFEANLEWNGLIATLKFPFSKTIGEKRGVIGKFRGFLHVSRRRSTSISNSPAGGSPRPSHRRAPSGDSFSSDINDSAPNDEPMTTRELQSTIQYLKIEFQDQRALDIFKSAWQEVHHESRFTIASGGTIERDFDTSPRLNVGFDDFEKDFGKALESGKTPPRSPRSPASDPVSTNLQAGGMLDTERGMTGLSRTTRERTDKLVPPKNSSPGPSSSGPDSSPTAPAKSTASTGTPSSSGTPSNKIYRLRGIPSSANRKGVVKRLIQKALSLDSPNSIHVKSLADRHDEDSKVATVSFDKVPACLSSANGSKDRWAFTVREESKDGSDSDSDSVVQLTFDNHFSGFTVLYSPPIADHTVDICAIHGLGGHAYGSWKERNGDHMWLLDRLPSNMKKARVMLYGYNSRLLGNDTFQDFWTLATPLRSSLEQMKRWSDDRGIINRFIWIGHSLGGLIIKEAMIEMCKTPRQHALLDATYGIIFCGTPSVGMDTEDLRQMVGDQPIGALLNSLDRDSKPMRDQNREFPKVFNYKDSEVFCFCETRAAPTPRFDDKAHAIKMDGPRPKRRLVDFASSEGHLRPWETEVDNALSLEKDHNDMVKFGANDDEFHHVLAVLRRFEERAVQVIPRSPETRRVRSNEIAEASSTSTGS